MVCSSLKRLVALFAALAVSAIGCRAQVLSFEEAKQRADGGDAFAQAVVALHYQLGWNTEKNPELAVKYALASANAGEPLGQFRLGALMRAGEGVAKDEDQGLTYQAASFNGLNASQDPYSLTAAGIMIFQGKVVGQEVPEDQRRKDAAKLYEKAAGMGYAPAQFNYAMALNDGHGVAQNADARDELIQSSAALGYPLAAKWLMDRKNSPDAQRPSEFHAEAQKSASRLASKELDLYAENEESTGIETVVQEVPERPQFAALGKGGAVLALLSETVVHFYEAKTGRLLRKISFGDQTGRTGQRIYAASSPSRFYVVLGVGGTGVGASEECFELDHLTGELGSLPLPAQSMAESPAWSGGGWAHDSVQVVGSNPENGTVAVYSSSGLNGLLKEIDSGSGAVKRRVNLPAAPREIVRAIYGQNGELAVVSISGGEVYALSGIDFVSPSGGCESISNPAVAFERLARSMGFNPKSISVSKKQGYHWFPDDPGVLIGDSIFGMVESMFLCTSAGILVREDKLFEYALSSVEPPQVFSLTTSLLPVDGISTSSDGSVILCWSMGFAGPNVWFRNDGKFISAGGYPRTDERRASAFTYNAGQSDFRPVSLPQNQVWNGAISDSGEFFAIATSNIRSNSMPNSQFYRDLSKYPAVPSVKAAVSIFDTSGGRLVAAEGESAIHPFEDGEFWAIVASTALSQTGIQLLGNKFVMDFVRWNAAPMEKSVELFSYATMSEPRFEGWRVLGNLPSRSVKDQTTGCSVIWNVEWTGQESVSSFRVLSPDFEGPWINAGTTIAAAYPLEDGVVMVTTAVDISVFGDYGRKKLSSWKLPSEGLKGGDYKPAVQTVALSGDKKTAYVLSGNHVVHRLSVGDAITPEAKLYPMRDKPPVVVLEDGSYLARGGGIQGVHFSRGDMTFPFEQFDLRLNRPHVVLERLGAPEEAVAIARQLREKRLKRMGVTEDMLKPDFHVPELEIVGKVPVTTDVSELNLSIKASDSKYTLERLKIYVNNVPVNGREGELLRDGGKTEAGLLGRITGAFSEASTGPQTLERTIPIKLAAGRNKIQVSVLNNAGAESLYANAEVNCTAKRPKPTLYAVAMGVSEYANHEWNLKYAAKDAQDVLARLKSKSGDGYAEVKELLLTDREVTKASIKAVREFLSGVTIDDTVLMFVAGHGLLDSNYDYYFGTTDIDFNNPADKGIAFEEFDDLLADLPSLKKSLLIDTCHAGELDEEEKTLLASAGGVSAALPTANGVAVRSIGTRGMNVKAVEGARGASEWYDRLQGLFVDLRRGSGSTILSSSAGAEYALESSEQQNGLFTYAVLEALDGKPDADTNKDGSVQMSELGEYVKKRVAELTNNKQTPNTRRVNLEGDFTLAKTK